jgi:hypothetical protein
MHPLQKIDRSEIYLNPCDLTIEALKNGEPARAAASQKLWFYVS